MTNEHEKILTSPKGFEQITLTEDSYARLLALLENPPEPNEKLIAAAVEFNGIVYRRTGGKRKYRFFAAAKPKRPTAGG
jgi:hypothetical protein